MTGWVVWRQDDNGNRYVVRRCATKAEAGSAGHPPHGASFEAAVKVAADAGTE